MGNPINNDNDPEENTDNIPTIIEQFENYYEQNSIYKTIFICDSDDMVLTVVNLLENNNHSVCDLYYEDLYADDSVSFQNKLSDFKTNEYRIFLLSYQTWYILQSEIKVFLLPHQNLITLGYIGEVGRHVIKNWVNNATMCGFIETTPTILELGLSDNDI